MPLKHLVKPDLIFVTNLTNQVSEEKLPCGEFSAFHVWRLQGNQKFLYMWRNFRCLPMTDVENSEILYIWHVYYIENVAIYAKFMLFSWKISFVKIYALCCEIPFVVIYALLCGGKFIQRFCMWRKNDKYQGWKSSQQMILPDMYPKVFKTGPQNGWQ